jgi:hypothetical protein
MKTFFIVVGAVAILILDLFITEYSRELTQNITSQIKSSVTEVWDNNTDWTIDTLVNDMDGTKSYIAASKLVTPTRPLSPPYDQTKSIIGVNCFPSRNLEYPAILLTKDILRTDGLGGSGARIKFDNDDPIRIGLVTPDGIIFRFDYDGIEEQRVIQKFMESSTVLLELYVPGEGLVYFRYSLDGAAEAISASPCRN